MEGVVAVQQFVSIGAHAFIAGGSLVRKNVPPFVKAAREPLTYSGVNAIGLRRRGFEADKISQIEDIYRRIYVHGSNVSKSIEEIKASIAESQEKKQILEFIEASEKGIIRGPLN